MSLTLVAAIAHARISCRKLVPCARRADPEKVGQRLAEIGEGLARSKIDSRPDAGSGDHQRDILARMIGARRGSDHCRDRQ